MAEKSKEVDGSKAAQNNSPAESAVETAGLTNHYCREYGKGFATAKTLGGHVSSAHGQSNSEVPPELEFACKVCQRGFPSSESLYGHMRSHPAGAYRGMNPHQIEAVDLRKSRDKDDGNKGCSDSEETESGMAREPGTPGAGGPLQTWPVKDQEGSGEIRQPVADCTSVSTAQESDAGDFQRNFTVQGSDQFKKRKFGGKDALKLTGPETASMEENPNSSHQSFVRPPMEENPMRTTEKGDEINPNQQKLKLGFLSTSSSSSRSEFRCKICGRTFATPQALGGHVASHKKLMIVVEDSIDAAPEPTKKVTNIDREKGYVCIVCNKSFASKRSLGGHKKVHCNRSGKDGKKYLDFDLNAMPSDGNDGSGN